MLSSARRSSADVYIESDISGISNSEWKGMLPTGANLRQTQSKLAAGELVLLSSNPKKEMGQA